MNGTERYLREYWFMSKGIGRLMLDLSLAQSAYENSYDRLPSSCNYETVRQKQKSNASPVERSAMIVIDNYRAEVESIERRLNEARCSMAAIEQTVKDAKLDPQESEYIRLRYFEDCSVEAIAQRMYCSVATCGRIRVRALSKVERCRCG